MLVGHSWYSCTRNYSLLRKNSLAIIHNTTLMLLNNTVVLGHTKTVGEQKTSRFITSSLPHAMRTRQSMPSYTSKYSTEFSQKNTGGDRKWNTHRDNLLATRFLNFTRPAGNRSQARALVTLPGFSKQTYPTSQCPHLCTPTVSQANCLGLFLEVSVADFCFSAAHTV